MEVDGRGCFKSKTKHIDHVNASRMNPHIYEMSDISPMEYLWIHS